MKIRGQRSKAATIPNKSVYRFLGSAFGKTSNGYLVKIKKLKVKATAYTRRLSLDITGRCTQVWDPLSPLTSLHLSNVIRQYCLPILLQQIALTKKCYKSPNRRGKNFGRVLAKFVLSFCRFWRPLRPRCILTRLPPQDLKRSASRTSPSAL